MPRPLVSILINNYNYGRYLSDAINSALCQTYSPIEVIVVDDGSTDDLRDVATSFGSKIACVFKANGGQASAFNAGIKTSHGEIVCFLDADDFFYPDKVERVVQIFERNNLRTQWMMVHHLGALKNAAGRDLNQPPFGRTHESPLNLYDFARRHRFLWYEAGPTSTIAMNRLLTDRLFPIPENDIRTAADGFIVFAAFLLGQVYSLPEILCGYRLHGQNLSGRDASGRSHYGGYQRLSSDFMNTLQNYLNVKLSEQGLLPVLSFDDSMWAWPYMRADKRWVRLTLHMLKTCFRDHDYETFAYAYHTVMEICMSAKKGIERTIRTPRAY